MPVALFLAWAAWVSQPRSVVVFPILVAPKPTPRT
jgi:hypothetical protein